MLSVEIKFYGQEERYNEYEDYEDYEDCFNYNRHLTYSTVEGLMGHLEDYLEGDLYDKEIAGLEKAMEVGFFDVIYRDDGPEYVAFNCIDFEKCVKELQRNDEAKKALNIEKFIIKEW